MDNSKVVDMMSQTESRAPYVVAPVLIFLPLASVAVTLRLWVRARIIRSLGWDDWMMLFALINYCVYDSALFMNVFVYKAGTHMSYHDFEGAINQTVVNEVFYLTTTIFLKLSLGIFFLRICVLTWQRYLVYTTMGLATLVSTVHIFFVIFMCGLPNHYVRNTINGTCVGNNWVVGMAYEQTAVTTVTDWIFASLPITMLWSANMDRRTKLTAGFLLSMGALGSVASVVRFRYVTGVALSHDFFLKSANLAIWSTIELGLGIFAGSLATLRPLFKRLFYRARSKPSRSSNRTYGYPYADGTGSYKKKGSRTSINNRSDLRTWGEAHSKGGTHLATMTGSYDNELDDLEAGFGSNSHAHGPSENRNCPTGPEQGSMWPFNEPQRVPEVGIQKVVNFEISSSAAESKPPSNSIEISQSQPLPTMPNRVKRSNNWKSNKSHQDDMEPWDKMPDLVLERQRTQSRELARSPMWLSQTKKMDEI